MIKSRHATSRPCQTLDPRTLGRPIRLLRELSAQLREDLAEQFRTSLNRRYRSQFEVGDVTMSHAGAAAQPGTWRAYESPLGRVGFAIDRSLILSVLAYRYGLPKAGVALASPDGALPSPTVTEERVAAMLGLQFVNLLSALVQPEPDHAGTDATAVSQARVLSADGPAAISRDAWVIKAAITETAHGVEGCLRFTLEGDAVARLLQNLAPLLDRPSRSREQPPVAAARLHLVLVARLLQKEITLEELAGIKVGDVIPVSLSAADVLVEGSRLFTAAVAEHKGKLCLTSFSDEE